MFWNIISTKNASVALGLSVNQLGFYGMVNGKRERESRYFMVVKCPFGRMRDIIGYF